MNKTLTICGCERRLWLAGLFVGLGMMMSLNSIILGVAVFACFAALGYARAKHPVLIHVLFTRQSGLYDPLRKKPFFVVVVHDPR